MNHTRESLKKMAADHAPGTKIARVELEAGDAAWHPHQRAPITGPCAVLYFFNEGAEDGVMVCGETDPVAGLLAG